MAWGEARSTGVLIPAACLTLAAAVAAFLTHPTTSRRDTLEQALRLFDAAAPPDSTARRRDAARRAVAASRASVGIRPACPARP